MSAPCDPTDGHTRNRLRTCAASGTIIPLDEPINREIVTVVPKSALPEYAGELSGVKYTRTLCLAVPASKYICASCKWLPAIGWDHCHVHGDVRAPLCNTCNLGGNHYNVGTTRDYEYRNYCTGHVECIVTRHRTSCLGCRCSL